MESAELFADTAAPLDDGYETLDVRDLPPPQPLQKTLETLESLEGAVLVQLNDRPPQMLYPQLEDRGYRYETVEQDDVAVTAIWTG